MQFSLSCDNILFSLSSFLDGNTEFGLLLRRFLDWTWTTIIGIDPMELVGKLIWVQTMVLILWVKINSSWFLIIIRMLAVWSSSVRLFGTSSAWSNRVQITCLIISICVKLRPVLSRRWLWSNRPINVGWLRLIWRYVLFQHSFWTWQGL